MAEQPARQIGRQLPYLRRYARAVTGSQPAGDVAVRGALERLLDEGAAADGDDLRLALYRALDDVLRAGAPPVGDVGGESPERLLADGGILASSVGQLAPPKRRILLLTALEGFAPEEAAAVMRLPPSRAAALLAEAKADLRSQRATRILIIEDEPIIALDIMTTVERAGHTVTGIAATRAEAVDLARRDPPELILADIQLADDSSGLDAVREILEAAAASGGTAAAVAVPVIFVTAFPERLLTGERPEPTFLITKPFDPDTLQVSISQAMAMAAARVGTP
jgi:CheY-like chemotaxis protein/DNA-directed RNA polymerase specialized sigma24 family protein